MPNKDAPNSDYINYCCNKPKVNLINPKLKQKSEKNIQSH